MNTVLPNDPLSAPHLFVNHFSSPRDHFNNQTMSGRKRKASEEPTDHDRMSTSPSGSPAITNRRLPSSSSATHRSIKKTRTGIPSSRPLALPRLLETLSADDMRDLLQTMCDDHPELQHEIVAKAPRPSLESTLAVLERYETAFRAAFPLGPRPTSDYAYNRVRGQQAALVEAVREFTPHFLPPHEPQDSVALAYLDAVTAMVHRLPDWDSFVHRRAKDDAYEEIARAWALVVREAGKRAGGFHLQFGGWDRKLVEHDQKSGGKMEVAVSELRNALGFMQGSGTTAAGPTGVSDERLNIRQQLFAGTFGQQQLGVGPGGW